MVAVTALVESAVIAAAAASLKEAAPSGSCSTSAIRLGHGSGVLRWPGQEGKPPEARIDGEWFPGRDTHDRQNADGLSVLERRTDLW